MSNKAPPTCFGELWKEDSVECRGGLDPLFSDPETNSNKREKCPWYSACGQQMVNRVAQQGEQLIPPNTLFRFPPPPPPVSAPQTPPVQAQPPFQAPPVQMPSYATLAQQVAQRVAAAPPFQMQPPTAQQIPVQRPPLQQQTFYLPNQQPVQQVQQPVQQYAQPQQYQPQYAQGMVPPFMASMPGVVPMNYVMPGTQMPSFLTVPEPIVHGQHWAQRLAFTLLRGMVKAFGMTLANFFDHTTVTPWQAPPPPPPPPNT